MQANGGASVVWNQGRAFGPFRRLQSFVFANQAWRYTDRTNRGFGDVRLGTRPASRLPGRLAAAEPQQPRRLRRPRDARPRTRSTTSRASSVNLGFETDSRRRIRGEVDVGIDREADGGSAYSTGLEIDWSVNDRLALSIDGELGMGVNERAWVTNEGFIRIHRRHADRRRGPRAPHDPNLDPVALPFTRSTPDALFARHSALRRGRLLPPRLRPARHALGKRDDARERPLQPHALAPALRPAVLSTRPVRPLPTSGLPRRAAAVRRLPPPPRLFALRVQRQHGPALGVPPLAPRSTSSGRRPATRTCSSTASTTARPSTPRSTRPRRRSSATPSTSSRTTSS